MLTLGVRMCMYAFIHDTHGHTYRNLWCVLRILRMPDTSKSNFKKFSKLYSWSKSAPFVLLCIIKLTEI